MIFSSILIFLSTAHAVPTQMGHQGRVLDADGLPAEGLHTLDFHLYDASEDGTMVWSEIHDVDLINGYYSLVLGADELDNPLDDSLLRDNELHLELTVGDDEPLSPRQALNAVPYARLAATATSVDGGSVNAAEVSISGALVIDSSGAWVGPTPTMSWSDLSDAPEDIDTRLSEEEVDAFCSDNGYAIAADLAAVATSGSFSDLSDVPDDVDTHLSEDEVDAFCANNGYAMASDLAGVATSGSFIDLRHVPVDMDTHLSEDEVDAFCENNGYAMASDLAAVSTSGSFRDLSDVPEDVDTHLSEDEVDAFCENNGYAMAADIPSSISSGAVGVNTGHFTESGTFVVPDGIKSLIVYITGGGGGGADGQTTSLASEAHSHDVASHSHGGGDHSHSTSSHTHTSTHSHSTTGYGCSYTSHGGGCGATTSTTGGTSVTTTDGSGTSDAADIGTTAGASLTTNAGGGSGGSITSTGGDGGSGGGLSALIEVTEGSECEITIGTGGEIGETGTDTTINCGEERRVVCTAGAGGEADGSNGLDGSCTSTGPTALHQFKASNAAPGGGGLGAKSTGAKNGQSGSVTIRY